MFHYDYPLADPRFGLPDQVDNINNVSCEYALVFGMIEGGNVINADRVVYDPQSPGNPRSFWNDNSKANELTWVCNMQEAQLFCGCSEIEGIKTYLFKNERITSAVIKNGTDGAIVIQHDKDDIHIPVFKTRTVWPIGTGDIFSASLALHFLIRHDTLEEAALKASLATAYYAETTALPLPSIISKDLYKEFIPKKDIKKKVYLAGPFFTMAQRWMIEQFRDQLIKFGFEVFSPFHDVGLGKHEVVVPADINAIKGADIIVAALDGLDAGTLFEIGYGIALNIPVLALAECEKEESLTMLKGTNCIIESDLSTLLYKTVWEAYK